MQQGCTVDDVVDRYSDRELADFYATVAIEAGHKSAEQRNREMLETLGFAH